MTGGGLGGGALGEDLGALEAVEDAGGFAVAAGGVAGVELWGFKRLAGGERVGKVEGIVTSGDTDAVGVRLFDGDAPAAGPAEFAEPDGAGGFGGFAAGGDGEPGVALVGGAAAAALEDVDAGVEGFGVHLPLGAPASGEGAELVLVAGWEIPGCGAGLLDGNGVLAAVFDGGPTGEDAFGVGVVVEVDEDGRECVFGGDLELAGGDFGVDELELEGAVAVEEADFEGGLVGEAAAPTGVFEGCGGDAGVKGGGFGELFGLGEGRGGVEAGAPVDGLEGLVIVDA